MSNSFVSYLNSLHNADANSKNAIAESQILDMHYVDIFVKRGIGDYLYNKLMKESPKTIILTGHAGDGKTSLVIQILNDLGCLPSDGLKKADCIQPKDGDRKLFYVKDMSELSIDKQDELLKQAFEVSHYNTSAILISNTGPLINSLKRFYQEINGDEKLEEFEMEILDRMDHNDEKVIKIGENECYVINIARLDNIYIIGQILNKIIESKLWEDCKVCKENSKCPILNNVHTIIKYESRLIFMINAFYRYMYENDNRFTIRQIISHLSYAITGNLSCKNINNLGKYSKFTYHFANQFFGYRKDKIEKSSLQIRSISELNKMSLDGIGLEVDFKLFVQENYEDFNEDIIQMLNDYRRFTKIEEAREAKDLQQHYRKTVRRFYILFSQINQVDEQNMINDLFSPIYSTYLKVINGDFEITDKKFFKTIIFEALYKLFIGIAPIESKDLYLTVRTEYNNVQYVQLLQGKIPADHFRIEFKQEKSIDSGFQNYRIVFKIQNINEEFPISLPLLNYFYLVYAGAVSTTLNPELSHGIDRLKSILAEHIKKQQNSDDFQKINLLIQTEEGPKELSLLLSENKLYVE